MLASGSGTNLQALIDDTMVRPHISVVISDRPEAGALRRAREAGIAADIVAWPETGGREAFSTTLADAVESRGAKGVVLAGFMRILSASFIERFPGRILNIHPSLLPSFPGAHAVADALAHAVKVTGVTVHVVDEAVDSGPIVAQVPVAVHSDDTVETLHARIQLEEHRIYPTVVAAMVEGRITVSGRAVEVR